MMRETIVITLMLSLMSASAGAQARPETMSVDSGRVVRMWVGNVETRGRLLAPLTSYSDSVRYCRYPGPPCNVPIRPSQLGWFRPDELEHLDVQVGTRAVKGAWIGSLIGAALGIGMGEMAYGFCDTGNCPSEVTAVGLGILTGGLFGGGTGALIGSTFAKYERRF